MKHEYFKLPYNKHNEQARKLFGDFKLLPLLQVEIISSKKSLRYMALIDSGADFCIFHSAIGRELGIEIKKGEQYEFGGIQKTLPSIAFFHKVDLKIDGCKYRAQIAFSDDIGESSYGILGHQGFFDKFDVGFSYREKVIHIKKANNGTPSEFS